jgi:hypothetical protein
VELKGSALQIGVVSNQEWNPVTVGYAAQSPMAVQVGDAKLEESSSLDALRAAQAGWFWDHQTNLWYVKVDFAGASEMETRVFSLD